LGIGANDAFIVQINRMTEIELCELLGDYDLPTLLKSKNSIML
jgi:hypothetical protein